MRRAARRSSQVVPGHDSPAPPGWARGHSPEARLHRRLRHPSRAKKLQAFVATWKGTATATKAEATLAELIIPKDERSGGALDAGVPEFIDFMMIDQPARQVAMRGGLAWLDQECTARFDKTFTGAADAERRQVLDDISGLEPARPDQSHGVAFFRSFRDLVSTGFWTSKMGMDDLQFMGNTFVAEWNGCPEEALRKLGLSGE